MYLETQKYLCNNSLEKLQEEFDIDATYNEDKTLVILNYSHINKEHKFHPIIKECRSLCLETDNYNVISRCFPRFFNLGEDPEGQSKFDWSNFITEEKIDGSLISLYNHKGIWRINTCGSFAQGTPHPEYKGTWVDLFEEAIGFKLNSKYLLLNQDYTYVFELCSKYNQTVIYYPKPKVYLLAIFNNKKNTELDHEVVEREADYDCLSVETPNKLKFNNEQEIREYIEKQEGYKFEGFVLRDINNCRIKLKNEEYLRLHRLKGNNNILLLKNLIPFIIEENADLEEAILYLPDVKQKVLDLKPACDRLKEEVKEVWNEWKDESVQKTFALAMKKCPYAGILFNARKTGDFEKAWRSSGNFIYENFFKA